MAEPSTTRAVRRRSRRGIRPRLVAALLIPTLAALAFGGLRVAGAVEDSKDATRAASIANALPDGFALALQLEAERDTAGADKASAKSVAAVEEATDTAVTAWQGRSATIDASRDPKLRQDLDVVMRFLGDLPALRARLADPATREDAQATYTEMLDILLGLAGRLPGLGDEQTLFRQAAALGQVKTAADALAAQRVIVTKALAEHAISRSDLTSLAAAMQSYLAASGFYYANTSPRAQRAFDDVNGVMGGPVGSHAPMQNAVATLVSTGDPEAVRMTPQEWTAAYADFLGKVVGIISLSATDLAAAVDEERVVAQRDAVVSAATVLLVLLLALVASVLLARSILRPLRRLREGALDIARRELPERVRALEDAEEVGDLDVRPIAVGSRDEIAEVGAAFDAVHAEAVRLAGEQAQMRANVSRMFVNLSRRSQSLVERQLRLIDELEAGEQDPEHLANLFRLDHLATRLRRNDESLLVLAGGDTGHGSRGPVPVIDVLRAASSEVEQFARVEVESAETAKFRGGVAGDLVHLLAELIENATSFSPPESPVVVHAGRTSPADPLVVEVRDLGIGMSDAELAEANAKLRRAGGLDADVARMMGLVVASRLAHRHGLVVELAANTPRGVVARVVVPARLLAEPAGGVPQDADVPAALPALAPVTEAKPAAPPEPVAPRPRVEPPTHSGAPAPAPAAPAKGAPALPKRRSVPVASEPPVESWFTTTVPLRDPEELLNTYLTGRAEGVDGAIHNPLARAGEPARSGQPPTQASTQASTQPSGTPSGAALTSSGLPTRIPRSQLPPDGAELREAEAPATPPTAQRPTGPVLDPLIADLAADVLSAPRADEALAEIEDDDTSIFATLSSEWFTRRTPLEARRSQGTPADDPDRADGADGPDVSELSAEPGDPAGTGWVSPGDEGWRRAAALADPAAVEQAASRTVDGLPVRVPGRNLVPGSAAPTPVPAAVQNVGPIPRPERRRTRGLSSFQQGVLRARSGDLPADQPADAAGQPEENRAHEEHQ